MTHFRMSTRIQRLDRFTSIIWVYGWLDSPADAAAGCPNTVTPFNDEHNAGILVLNTADFPDDRRPLFDLKP